MNMPPPLAYFLTWTTYGTWLPGDERGWVKRGEGLQLPETAINSKAESLMTETPCWFDREQRAIVEETISEHCNIRGWHLHAVQCRSNHVHVVVTADRKPEDVRSQFKAWTTRKLKELMSSGSSNNIIRKKWWTEKGSCRYINDENSLEAAIIYVKESQDHKHKY